MLRAWFHVLLKKHWLALSSFFFKSNKSNIWSRTWNWDDPINKKAKKTLITNILKNALRKNKSRIGLILQIYYLNHETEMTLLKTYLKKQKSKILNQTNIEWWNWEKKINQKTFQNKKNSN